MARVVVVKRLSILFSIVIRAGIFQEQEVHQRFVVASVMLLGVLVMTMA